MGAHWLLVALSMVAVTSYTIGAEPILNNVALGKPAYIYPSTSDFPPPGVAVDGITNPHMSSWSCAHSDQRHQDRPWWKVDLGGSYQIKTVRILNRKDCCAERLDNFNIYVGFDNITNSNNALCHHQCSPVGAGAWLYATCPQPLAGRYVIIQIMGPSSKNEQVLTLCEVEVFREPILNNVALGKPAYIYPSTSDWPPPGVAVDGITSPHMSSWSCAHSDQRHQDRPWWKVDLGGSYQIKTVRILNRKDCCAERLDYFSIYVGFDNITNSNNALCHHQSSPVGDGAWLDATCPQPLAGRYVIIQIVGPSSKEEEILTLCEVEVFGEAVPASTNQERASPDSV